MNHQVFPTGIRFFFFFFVYLLLAAKVTLTEVIAGVCVAGVVTASFIWLRAKARLRFTFKPSWFWLLLRKVTLKAITDCGWVFLALWRYAIYRKPIQGKLWSIPFDAGGDDIVSASRRALVLGMVSLTPNTLSIVIKREKGVLLLHQLVDTGKNPGEGDWKWPI